MTYTPPQIQTVVDYAAYDWQCSNVPWSGLQEELTRLANAEFAIYQVHLSEKGDFPRAYIIARKQNG